LEIKCPRCGLNNHLLQTERTFIASRRLALTVKPVMER
jgi:phage FluMu protein Com